MTCHQQGTPARPASPKRFPTWFPEHHWLLEAPVSRCLSQPAHLLLCPGPQARTASCFHNVWNFPWPGPGSSSPCPHPFLSPAPHSSILLSLSHWCGEPPPASHSPVPDPWGQPHASTFRAYPERTALTLWPRPRHPRLLVTQRPPRCPGRHPFSPFASFGLNLRDPPERPSLTSLLVLDLGMAALSLGKGQSFLLAFFNPAKLKF